MQRHRSPPSQSRFGGIFATPHRVGQRPEHVIVGGGARSHVLPSRIDV
jgi:hypothetical protein